MNNPPSVERVGDYIHMGDKHGSIAVHVDDIIEFIKTVFVATTGHEFQEDKEK